MDNIEREIKRAIELRDKNYAYPKGKNTLADYAEAFIGSILLVAIGYLVIQIASLLN